MLGSRSWGWEGEKYLAVKIWLLNIRSHWMQCLHSEQSDIPIIVYLIFLSIWKYVSTEYNSTILESTMNEHNCTIYTLILMLNTV